MSYFPSITENERDLTLTHLLSAKSQCVAYPQISQVSRHFSKPARLAFKTGVKSGVDTYLNGIRVSSIGLNNTQTSWKNVEMPFYTHPNLVKLNKLFENELQHINKSESPAYETSLKLLFSQLKSLSELNFGECAIDIIRNKGLKITLTFSDNKLLMINKSFENSNEDFVGNYIYYSFFINRKLIASNVSEIKKFVEGFKKYLEM